MDGGDSCSGGGNVFTKVATGVTETGAMQDMGAVTQHSPLLSRGNET